MMQNTLAIFKTECLTQELKGFERPGQSPDLNLMLQWALKNAEHKQMLKNLSRVRLETTACMCAWKSYFTMPFKGFQKSILPSRHISCIKQLISPLEWPGSSGPASTELPPFLKQTGKQEKTDWHYSTSYVPLPQLEYNIHHSISISTSSWN